MSSELVRQALAFVDPDGSTTKPNKNKKRNNSLGDFNKANPFKPNIKKKKIINKKSKKAIAEENIKKLLALSTPTNADCLDKIIERAIKGKPLQEKIDIKEETEKSILFPEESFNDFENTYFCS